MNAFKLRERRSTVMKKKHQSEKIDQNKRQFMKKAWKTPIIAQTGALLLMSAATSKALAGSDAGGSDVGPTKNPYFQNVPNFSK